MEGKPKSAEGEGEEDEEFGDFASPAGASVSDEEKVQNLVGMGFDKGVVTKALATSGGNVQGAMSILMGGTSGQGEGPKETASEASTKQNKAPPSEEVLVGKKEEQQEQDEKQEKQEKGTSSTEASPAKPMLSSSSGLGLSGRGLLQKAALFGKSVESSLESASNLLDVGIDYCQDKAKEKKVVEKVSSLKTKTFSSFGSVFTKSSSMTAAVASVASKAADKASSAAGTLNAGKLMSTAGIVSKGSVASSKDLSEPVLAFQMPKGQTPTTFRVQETRVVCACESSWKLGSLLPSSSSGATQVCFFEASTGSGGLAFSPAGFASTSKSPICALAVSDGFVAVGDRSGSVYLAQGPIGERGREGMGEWNALAAHTSEVSALQLSKRYGTLISAGLDGTVRVHRCEQRATATEFKAPSAITGLQLHPDEKRVILSCSSGCLCVGVANVLPAPPLEVDDSNGHAGCAVECVAVSVDGGRVASGGADRRVIIWSLVSTQLTALLTLPCPVPDAGLSGTVSSVTFCGSGVSVAAAHVGGQVALWELAGCIHTNLPLPTGEKPERPEVLRAHVGGANEVQWDSGRRLVWSAGQDGMVRLWKRGADFREGMEGGDPFKFDADESNEQDRKSKGAGGSNKGPGKQAQGATAASTAEDLSTLLSLCDESPAEQTGSWAVDDGETVGAGEGSSGAVGGDAVSGMGESSAFAIDEDDGDFERAASEPRKDAEEPVAVERESEPKRAEEKKGNDEAAKSECGQPAAKVAQDQDDDIPDWLTEEPGTSGSGVGATDSAKFAVDDNDEPPDWLQ